MVINVGKKEDIYTYNLPGGISDKMCHSFKNTHTNQPINSVSKNYSKETIINMLKVNYKGSHSILYNGKHLKIT